ncbi:2558_t:CDS:10 [Funneliformis mosseae]|uniref:2558_t:CDS:1 n=1 Tax=Funneliformis mosseae TaxID=27381 RepID=A0A9N9CVX3_FUNMO|nr:2558_t:CDS:10 [Funneliformis mosseae]
MSGSKVYVYLCAALSAIGGLLFGYDIGVISGILTMPHFREEFPADPVKEGTIVSSLLAGCFFGALISGYFADKVGRRFSILGGSLFFIVGCVLQATSTTFVQLYFGRIISGLSIGPKEIRGRLVTLQQWSITIGIAISFWIDYVAEKIDSPVQWRIPLCIQTVPAIILAVGTLFLPFSPRWLMDHNREEEAIAVLAKLRAGGDKNAAIVQEEYLEIKDNVLFEREFAAKNYFELVKKGPENIRRRMILGIFIQIFQQLTGINAIMYYAPQIFINAGLTSNSSSLLATGINGLVNMLSTIPAILWIDRWGRRPTLISGGILMGISMLIIGLILALNGNKYYDPVLKKNFVKLENKSCSYAVIVFIYTFVASFAYSWGPTGWIYPAEIYPLRIRSKAMSVTTASNWLINIIIGQIVPSLLDKITWGTFIIFGVFGMTMAISVLIYYPETKGKSLEEMDGLFGKTHSRSINQHLPPSSIGDLEHGESEIKKEASLSTSPAEINVVEFPEKDGNYRLIS